MGAFSDWRDKEKGNKTGSVTGAFSELRGIQEKERKETVRTDTFQNPSSPTNLLNNVMSTLNTNNQTTQAPKAINSVVFKDSTPEVAKPKTLKETVAPLSIQSPLKRGGAPAKTQSDLRKDFVESKLESDRKGSSSNKVLSTINSLLEPVSKVVYTGESYLAPFQKGAGNALGIQAKTAPYEPTVLNKGLEIAGAIGGSVTNPSNISQGLVTAPLRAGQQLANKAAQVSPKLGNNIVQRAIEGTTAGAIQGGVISGVRGETGAKELATNIGLGAALGGVGDAALAGIGSGVRALAQRMKNNNVSDEAIHELLALPAPRQRGNTNTAVTDDVINASASPFQESLQTPLGLPSPSVSAPTTARVATSSNPYRQQFENLINVARQQEFTPGRESEELESLWSQMAGTNDVNLDELITRAYEARPSRVTSDLVERARNYQNSRQAAGVDLPVKTLSERTSPQGVLNNVDIASRFGRNPEINVRQAAQQLDTTLPQAETSIILPNNSKEVTAPKESWFEKLFGRSGVGIRAGANDTRRLVDTQITRNAKKDAPFLAKAQDAASVANQDYVDRFAPFRNIDDNNATYNSAMDSTRANNLANVAVKDKLVDLEGNVIGNSLADVYTNIPRGQKNLADTYIVMRDAVDRMKRGIKVYESKNPDAPKTWQEAQARVLEMEQQNPWLLNFGSDWNDFNTGRQELWVQSGIASSDMIKAFRSSNPNYAPMMRQQKTGAKNVQRFNNGKEFSGNKLDVKRAVGGESLIIEPAQSMINSTASSYQAMLRNRAMQNLYKEVEANPEKYRGIIEIVPEHASAKQESIDKINKLIQEDGFDAVAESLNDELTLLFNKGKQASATSKDNHVTVMINGEPVKMNVMENGLIRAIEGVSPERLEGILRIADVLSRGVKQAATGALAPLQGVKLFARDIPVAFAQSKDKVRFLQDISQATISQVADWLPEFVPGAQNLGKLAREYYRAGGGYEQYLKGDSRIRAAASDITRDPLLSGRNIAKQIRKTGLGLRPLKEFGDAMENIPRIAAFQAAMRKSGWARDEASVRNALNEAREATVNWSRKGAKGQQIESVLPYSNAAVQGTYRLAKFMKEQPVSSLSFITALTGATVASYEQFKDDPDYKNRSKYAKGIVVSKTKDGKFVTIPTEPAYQYIADQVLNFYKWAKDNEQLPPATESIQEWLDAFTPKYVAGPASLLTAEGNGSNRFQTGVANTLGGSSLEPLVATATGKNYFGGDIIPREYKENSTPFQQSEKTSAAANWAAENLGMDAFTFDYLAQKFGGDLAKVTLPMTSKVGRGDPTGNMVDEVLTRLQLLEDPVMKNNLSNEYYKFADKVTQTRADANRSGTELPTWYQDIYDNVTSTKKGSVASQISDFNKEKKNIQNRLDLTAKQRSDMIRGVQTQINLLRIKGIEIMEKAGVK